MRSYHKFVDKIENSVPRAAVSHPYALPCDAKQWPEGQNRLNACVCIILRKKESTNWRHIRFNTFVCLN